jgi:hypothetical protein
MRPSAGISTPIQLNDDGRWVTQTKLAEQTINGQEQTSYQLIGATANNLLLIATYNGGGSGTFYTLHILDVSGQRAFDMDGDVYQRINVTSVRNIVLGDRWDGDVKISGNTILVTTIMDGPAIPAAPPRHRGSKRRALNPFQRSIEHKEI